MRAYTAQIIYRIKCDGIASEQYEEQWRLVYAADDREALFQSRVLAKKEEASFVDRHGRTVFWEFVAVKDLQEVEMTQGALLFSELKEVQPIASPLWTEQMSVAKQTENCH